MSYRRVMGDIEHGKREPTSGWRQMEAVGRAEQTRTEGTREGYSAVFVSGRNGGTLYTNTGSQKIKFQV